MTKEIQKRNQRAYMAEAALEYFVSILVADAFLATVLSRIGVSDAATGIITQIASFAFVAQSVSMFYRRKKRMKRWVTLLYLVNQLMFVTLYVIPVIPLGQTGKTALFVVMFLGGQLLANVASPYLITWLMGFVDDGSRGRFTANKEILSLLGGMAFTFGMGTMVDKLTAAGKADLSFLLCGVTIFVLAMLHLLSVVLVRDREAPKETQPTVSPMAAIRSTLANRSLRKVFLVDILWRASVGVSVSFFGSYKIHELGFSLQFVSILSILYAVFRALFSRFFGKYADKHSWAKMLVLCFGVAALSFGVNMFTCPGNGRVLFAVYYCIYAVSMAGINSGLMNVTFDYVPREERAAALGVKNAIGGIAAFLASLIGSVVVQKMQDGGNLLFGHTVYAQQVLSAVAFLMCLGLLIYTSRVVVHLPRSAESEPKL